MTTTIDIRDLSPEDVKKVQAFIASLKLKDTKKNKRFKFDWEGGLKDSIKDMNAVDLQHKSLDWR